MRISDWSSDVCSSDRGQSFGAAVDGQPRCTVAFDGRHRRSQLDRRGIADTVEAQRPGHQCVSVEGMPIKSRDPTARRSRSEEHTSELQSLMRISYDVFCLKKKKRNK